MEKESIPASSPIQKQVQMQSNESRSLEERRTEIREETFSAPSFHNSKARSVPGMQSSSAQDAKHSAFGLATHGLNGLVGASNGYNSYPELRDTGGQLKRSMEEGDGVERTSTADTLTSKGSSNVRRYPDINRSREKTGSVASRQPLPTISSERQEPLNMSDGNNCNIVAASAATVTTSSGDDPDPSWGMRAIGIPREETRSDIAGLHHHRHQPRRRVLEIDGSTLQVPEDDGFHRLLGGPAAVVASRLPPPNSDTTSNFSSSCSGGEAEPSQETLLQPHKEPGYHTIRKTFSKLPKRGDARIGQRSSRTDSSSTLDEVATGRTKSPKTSSSKTSSHDCPKTKKRWFRGRADPVAILRLRDPGPVGGRGSPSPDSINSCNGGGEGSSSGSGTEGGYAGSASSNENSGQQESSSSSSPSTSSSEDSRPNPKSKRKHRSRRKEKVSQRPENTGDYFSSSSSSEIADFSSGASILNEESLFLSSANEESLDELEETYLHAKKAVVEDQVRFLKATARRRKASDARMRSRRKKSPAKWTQSKMHISSKSKLGKTSPILRLGSDVMAHVLTFLHPPDILDVLTMPLSKEWRQRFTMQPELWRVLCLVEPFKAQMDDNSDSDMSEDSYVSIKVNRESFDKVLLDRYRLLYTSFVRCMKYLSQIREDALNGREPTFIDYGGIAERGRSSKRGPPLLLGSNKNLQLFLARARGVVEEAKSYSGPNDNSNNKSDSNTTNVAKESSVSRRSEKRKAESSHSEEHKIQKRLKLGKSMITGRLLGPSQAGDPGNLTLPWSCAIYSIVNWMVAFLDVEGIQILCLKVLPFLLEDEKQRMTAQRSGLTDVILRAMVLFEKSVHLHIAAFHTIVLLARPLGGREGMLFHSSMVASGIFGGQTSQHRKNGIAVMVDSMRRFEDSEILQAMSCWALVNIALAPAQKAVLVKLGGIQATLNAMLRHPFNAEVQFRALFALINLVIPSISLDRSNPDIVTMQDQSGEANETTEKEIIDELVGEIGNLVVRAMTNFCSSEAILNRACLVLHNLSLTPGYHETLLWTQNCYQMLEWCLANYRIDQVLQHSASGTLNRLQTTLSNDDNLRTRFAESLNAQHRRSLHQAHNEALRMYEQQ